MKNLFTTLVVLMFSLSANSQTKAIPYADSGLIAAFPVEPVVEKNEMNTQLGKIKLINYQAEGEDYMILVSQNELTKEAVEKLGATGAKGMIDGAKNGAVKNLETQLGSKFKGETDENFLFNGKYAANKSTGTIDGSALSTLTIMKENRLYFVMAMGNLTAEPVVNFFKTFNVIE